MKLIHNNTSQDVKIGDRVTSFRGEEMTVTGIEAPRHSASTGRVYVNNGQGYYPSVFGLSWIN